MVEVAGGGGGMRGSAFREGANPTIPSLWGEALGKASKKKLGWNGQADRLGWPPPPPMNRSGKCEIFLLWFFTLVYDYIWPKTNFTKKIFFDHRKFLWRLLETLHDIHGFSCLGAVKKAIYIKYFWVDFETNMFGICNSLKLLAYLFSATTCIAKWWCHMFFHLFSVSSIVFLIRSRYPFFLFLWKRVIPGFQFIKFSPKSSPPPLWVVLRLYNGSTLFPLSSQFSLRAVSAEPTINKHALKMHNWVVKNTIFQTSILLEE